MILCPEVDRIGYMRLGPEGYGVPSNVVTVLGYSEWDRVTAADFITRWCRHVGATWVEGLVILPAHLTFEDNGRGQSGTMYVGVTPDVRDVVSLSWVTLYRVAEVWS